MESRRSTRPWFIIKTYTQRMSYWFPENPERTLWIDFDVATAFPSRESMGSEEEYEIVKDFGELLVRIPLTLLLT